MVKELAAMEIVIVIAIEKKMEKITGGFSHDGFSVSSKSFINDFLSYAYKIYI